MSVCVMITLRTVASAGEVKLVSDAAEMLTGKSVDYLLAVALLVSNVALLYVTKAYQAVTRESQITAVETARASQRMADSIDKLAAAVTLHDERAIKFIDRQNSYGDHHAK